ncbi:pentulose/hexulose kinase [Sulfuricella denitrificans skB26]|uniref:D-ribulose kinase n=1 Tax=Sulfuricella denitrificans (strain DSM 22764 / NBRC 105220 / skB26) TaxID=1163617 RepID=S6ACD6_SULDS|nr:FGGY-family carbohydrate kinase [Sulfuricella denitrificans]BAN35493.1 pentulose/hexulose kinase [Sulfuricella denitrificans skB26]
MRNGDLKPSDKPTPHPSLLTPHAFLGIDFGTSGARAIAINSNGDTLAEARSGYTDQTAVAWRAALFDLIGQIPADIRRLLSAIAINGTSTTALLCDAENRPLYPPLLYNDARAQDEAKQLAQITPPGHPVLSASSSLAKLLWFQKQPEFPCARFFLHQADWLASLLHGRPGISDYHNSLKLGFDPETLRYPEWLLQLEVVPLLPRVLAPGTAIGPVTAEIAAHLSLPRNCLIRAGTTDSIAAFIASGACRPGQAVTSLGSTLVLKLLSRKRVDAAQYGIYSHRIGNLWLAGGASNSGGAVLRSFFSDPRLKVLSSRIPPETDSGLDYYPLPCPGERFPINDPEFEPRLTPRPQEDALFLHGLLEGIARIEAQGYRLLQELGADPLESVLTAGGGADNPAWTSMRTRFLGVPVQPSSQVEAAFGSALLAARGENLLCYEQSQAERKN